MLKSDPPDPRVRVELARRQAQLVGALSGGDIPDGFDSKQLAIAAESLARKRAGILRKMWPMLFQSLGDDFTALFADYAATFPPPEQLREDGLGFARWLQQRKAFPADARLELACRQAAVGFPLRLLLLRGDRRLVLVYRLCGTVRARSLRWGSGI
jgi:hypothetical protein